MDAVTGIGKVHMDLVWYNTPIFHSHSHTVLLETSRGVSARDLIASR